MTSPDPLATARHPGRPNGPRPECESTAPGAVAARGVRRGRRPSRRGPASALALVLAAMGGHLDALKLLRRHAHRCVPYHISVVVAC